MRHLDALAAHAALTRGVLFGFLLSLGVFEANEAQSTLALRGLGEVKAVVPCGVGRGKGKGQQP